MKLVRLIPNIFYSDIAVGLQLFVDVLGFTIVYSDTAGANKFYIIEREGVKIHLVENDEFAKKDRPEIRIETDDIDALHQELSSKEVKLFHPNLPAIKLQPWGLREFGLLDKSHVCVVIQQTRTYDK